MGALNADTQKSSRLSRLLVAIAFAAVVALVRERQFAKHRIG